MLLERLQLLLFLLRKKGTFFLSKYWFTSCPQWVSGMLEGVTGDMNVLLLLLLLCLYPHRVASQHWNFSVESEGFKCTDKYLPQLLLNSIRPSELCQHWNSIWRLNTVIDFSSILSKRRSFAKDKWGDVFSLSLIYKKRESSVYHQQTIKKIYDWKLNKIFTDLQLTFSIGL